MDKLSKIEKLGEKIKELKFLLEDFVNSYHSKKSKIDNLEIDIENIKKSMSSHLDEIENLIDDK